MVYRMASAASDLAYRIRIRTLLLPPRSPQDLGRLGRRLGLCPYYGSRALVSEADVVALPYSALLSAETRGSLGLHLEGSVVIFDEAHNLVDAVLGAHGAQVSGPQLATAHRWVVYQRCVLGVWCVQCVRACRRGYPAPALLGTVNVWHLC